MARWSPTVLPYAPNPFEAGDRIARGIYGGVQLDQGQQRLDDMSKRTDIYAANSEMGREAQRWANIAAEAELRDRKGWNNGTPNAETLPAREGQAPETAGLPSPEQATPAKPVRLQSDFGGPPVPIGAQPGPQYATGDVRNHPGVQQAYEQATQENRIQMATEGSIAPMGQRPADIYGAQERRRVGGATYDYLSQILDLPPEARSYMEEVGPNLPGLKPYQEQGYNSAEEAARDAYLGNRVEPPVLAATIRANSTEGRGALTAGQQMQMRDAEFMNNVYNYVEEATAAGQPVSIQQAATEVARRTGYQGTVSFDELARGYDDLTTGDFEGYSVPLKMGESIPLETRVSVSQAVRALDTPTAGAADLARITAAHQNDQEWLDLFWQTLAARQRASMAERFGGGFMIGGGVTE